MVLTASLGLAAASPAAGGMPVGGCPAGWVLDLMTSPIDRNGDGAVCTRGQAVVDNVADESATQKPPKTRHD